VLDREITDAELDAAVQVLADPERLAGAQDAVARIAPQLQQILDQALEEGGWFGNAHAGELNRVALSEDPAARLESVRLLVAEETRLGMLVGVAVGIELARELTRHPTTPPEET